MFNYGHITGYWRVEKVMGGLDHADGDTFRTLFCGKFGFAY